MTATRILNATSGSSSEFSSSDGKFIFRLTITGSPSSSIQAFLDGNDSSFPGLALKIKGLSDYGGGVKLQAKTNNTNDDFSDTGRTWSADYAGVYIPRQSN
ncbi:MAG: hypothetical protein EBS06_05475 [Proteobacteria bacterium]|nr:hypothetical protein [Pseudomonadota bacterium]